MSTWTPNDWLNAGGLGVAALALVLTYLDRRHARAENYRAAFYAAQLQAIRDLLQAAGAVHTAARELATDPSALRERLTELLDNLSLAHNAGVAVLPTDISDAALNHFSSVVEGLQTGPDLEKRQEAVVDAWQTLVATVQRDIGAQSLGKQIRKLTGARDAARLEQIRQEVRRVGEYYERRAGVQAADEGK